ncbi:hypothetical protein [Nocardia sp. NPDC050435]|uniref:hypothetical protein n=1 Tax=Nocardia sp. NPDC050435 TaxID=3155040 RepID=UPI0033C97F40
MKRALTGVVVGGALMLAPMATAHAAPEPAATPIGCFDLSTSPCPLADLFSGSASGSAKPKPTSPDDSHTGQ